MVTIAPVSMGNIVPFVYITNNILMATLLATHYIPVVRGHIQYIYITSWDR